jgi:hypothetical protein
MPGDSAPAGNSLRVELRLVIASRRAAIGLTAALLISSYWAVYTRYVDLRAFDPVQNQTYRELSVQQYRETLAGRMSFPAQWRLLGFWLVRGIERSAGVDPHIADATVKTVTLAATAAVLCAFARALVSPLAAIFTSVLYLFINAVAYAPEGYAIYHTNDYLLVLGWFTSAYALREGRWPLAAAAIFATAWAKESIGLAVLLAALEAWRGRLSWAAAVACALAFAVPTMILRTAYAAPITEWAWWTENLGKNLPFYSLAPGAVATAVRNDVKVLLFFQVAGLVAAWAWWRSNDGFVRSLGGVLLVYLAAGWATFMFRELRHFLPTMILVLPLAVAELERHLEQRS